jgi:DNA-binding winged helix-turn-helix (wHTH) protein/TolB-like protein/Flp pilus assembly protein TadD
LEVVRNMLGASKSNKIKRFYEFEKFRLDSENPSLWRDGELISVPPKVLELLILLVEKRGEIVSREELLETVWKDTFVEEGNINYTVSLLRKTLGGKNFIQTVPRRGYRFAAEINEIIETDSPVPVVPGEKSVVVQGNPKRWALAATVLISIFFLTSFTVWWRYYEKDIPLNRRNIKTVAILPLKNLDESDANSSLALGLTDSLINRLGSLNRFVVRPLSAVEKYSQSETDALDFGRKLKVDAILEGTIQTAESRLRVNARLIDARDGSQIWAGIFDENEVDIFVLQDKLSAQVADSITLRLTPVEAQNLKKHYTESAEAYRAYIRGRAILEKRKPEFLEKAIDEFQKAVALDPTFALAYTGFANAFITRGNLLSGETSADAVRKARLYARKALELDPELAEGYVARGRISRIFDWDWDAAEKDFRRAIELNPNYAEAQLGYAQMLSFLGRHDEAMERISKAIKIDPISPPILTAQFAILESRGEIDEGLKRAEEFFQFDKQSPFSKRALGTFLFHKDEHQRLIEMGEKTLSGTEQQEYIWLSLLATAYHRTNQIEKMNKMIERLESIAQNDSKALYSLAKNYGEIGRADDALALLEKCFELREQRMVWLKVEPRFNALRNDSRFQALLQKMQL